MVKSDSGMKFDQGKINRILALVIDLSDLEVAQLMTKLRQELVDRGKSGKDNIETTQV